MNTEKQYYTVKPVFKIVSEEEFKTFISNYPRKLRFDCCDIADPPLATYNDFELADRWPYSIVTRFDAGEPNEHYGFDYKRTYEICENYEELFASKTGLMAKDIES